MPAKISRLRINDFRSRSGSFFGLGAVLLLFWVGDATLKGARAVNESRHFSAAAAQKMRSETTRESLISTLHGNVREDPLENCESAGSEDEFWTHCDWCNIEDWIRLF